MKTYTAIHSIHHGNSITLLLDENGKFAPPTSLYYREGDVVELLAKSLYELYRHQNPGARMFAWDKQPCTPTRNHWGDIALAVLNGEDIKELVR